MAASWGLQRQGGRAHGDLAAAAVTSGWRACTCTLRAAQHAARGSRGVPCAAVRSMQPALRPALLCPPRSTHMSDAMPLGPHLLLASGPRPNNT